VKIIERPYDESQLRELARDGERRIAGVVAVAWHDLPGWDQDRFEEELARRVTGTRYGLADIGIKLAGVLGQNLLLEVSGDVSMLLADYDLVMASEREEAGDARSA
jgi:hypothetical protein